MQPADFIKNNVLKLESKNFDAILSRLSDPQTIRLLHAAIGMNTEAGEVIDLLKKKAFYGKEVDQLKFVDEIGDLLWYMGLACDVLGVSFEEIMDRNTAKLTARYGEKFSESAALNRNTAKEAEALQKGTV
jgi:NTP pyrophosphatase (non-canonical NTP hydrolase)